MINIHLTLLDDIQHKLQLDPEDVDDEVDVLLAGDDDVVDGATAAAIELLHLVSCLPAPVFNPEIFL